MKSHIKILHHVFCSLKQALSTIQTMEGRIDGWSFQAHLLSVASKQSEIDGPLDSFLFSETCFLRKRNSSGKSATAVTLKLVTGHVRTDRQVKPVVTFHQVIIKLTRIDRDVESQSQLGALRGQFTLYLYLSAIYT